MFPWIATKFRETKNYANDDDDDGVTMTVSFRPSGVTWSHGSLVIITLASISIWFGLVNAGGESLAKPFQDGRVVLIRLLSSFVR